MKSREITICGLAAVRAQFAADAGAMKRLYFDLAMSRRIGAMCRAFAQEKKVYRCVEPAELEKVGGTLHHGGIVAVISATELRAPTATELRDWARRQQPVLVLDRIGNAHNLGAIARTAAFFGVAHVILPADPAAAQPNDAAYRVAEGGLAHLEIFRVTHLPGTLRQLVDAGFAVIGAAARGGRPDARASAGKPVALVLGNEEHGLSVEVAAACTRLVTLPGSGNVESLNVSAAAAVLMWELWARAKGSTANQPDRSRDTRPTT